MWREGGALFFRPKNGVILATELKRGKKNWRGKNKKIGELEVGCIYIKERFKPIFPFFLNCLLYKLRCLIPTVTGPSGPPV